MMDNQTRLSLICTDNGTHVRREVALVEVAPAGLHEHGFAVWGGTGPPPNARGETVSQTVRQTKHGSNRVTDRRPIPSRVRRDGGRTYYLICNHPGCNARKPRPLRDDTIARIVGT